VNRPESRAFVALFFAEVISTMGSEMAAIALPWFVLITTGSPARMGAVMAAEFVGMALLGVPSGRPLPCCRSMRGRSWWRSPWYVSWCRPFQAWPG
jgi:hypothetical protein